MRTHVLWKNRWPLVRWALFIAALGAVEAGLYVKLPSEPRWVLAGGPMRVFNAGDGWIGTYPLAEGMATGPLQVCDAATGREAGRYLDGAAAFQDSSTSADGRRFVALLKGDKPDACRIRGVDLDEQREWQTEAPVGPFTSATFSPRCNFVVLRMPPAREAADFHTIVETASGRIVAHLPGNAEQIYFGGNGGVIAAGYSDEENQSEIRVVNTGTGKATVIDGAHLLGISPDSRWLIGDRGDQGVCLWDVAGSRWHAPLGEPKAQPARRKGLGDYELLFHGHIYLQATQYNVRYAHRRININLHGARNKYSSLFSIDSADGRIFSPDSRFLLCTAPSEPGHTQLTLFDVQTGKPLWKRNCGKNPQEPMFTPDSRRIIVVVPDAEQAEVMNVATGETERTIPLRGAAGLSAQLTRDGRTLVVAATPPEREPHWFLARIEAWLAPRPETAPVEIRAFALETGEELGELLGEETDDQWLSDDRQRLVTVCSESDEQGLTETTIRCWDMHPHKPLHWALGVPSALAVVLVSLRFGWRRWRRRQAVASAPKPAPSGA